MFIKCCDVFELLKSIDNNSIDLIITDLPYESLEKYRKIGTTTRLKNSKSSSNDWFKIFPNEKIEPLFIELFRVLKYDSHFYIFCDSETSFIMKPIGEKVGFKFWKPLIFDKEKIGMGYHYRARYEMILFFEKGKRKLNDLSIPDILSEKRVLNGYPTEKPVKLLETLIKQSSDEGNIVLDPFMGSGSIVEACINTNRDFIGCDISEKSYETVVNRIKGIK